MKNYALSQLREIIPYSTAVKNITGSTNSAILMVQLDYWFKRYPDGFYKFLAPCDHEEYVPGDSWLEELNFTDEEFRTAILKICKCYPSLTEYKKSFDENNIFQGKFYATYRDRLKGKTYYFRNHELMDKTLDEMSKSNDRAKIYCKPGKPVYVNRESPATETGNPGIIYKEAETTTEITTKDTFGDLQQETEQNQALGVLKENAVCELDEISEDLGKKRKHKPYPEDFEKWWAFYPKKDSKKDASKAFLKAKKRIDLEELIAKTKIYVDQYTRKQPTLEFMPHGATWLNGDEWEDVEDQYQLQKLNKPINPDENDLETFISNETGPWKGFLENLYRTLGKPWFISWMKRSADERLITLFKIEDNIAYLHTSTQFMADKLKNDFDHYIRSAIVKNYANVVDYEISKAF